MLRWEKAVVTLWALEAEEGFKLGVELGGVRG